MTALTKDRNTPYRSGTDVSHPIAASALIFLGSIVCLDDSGNAVPGSTSTTLVAAGRASETVDNSAGATGDDFIPVQRGVFQYVNDGSIDRTHIGSDVYIVDDQTLSSVSTGKSVAGKLIDLDTGGVWVEIK